MRKNDLPEYRAWKAMKARCYAPVNSHLSYQKNGIKVCDRWKDNFEAFYADMGCRPSKKHSLDRIDNAKDYSPDNCRWATQSTQCANRGDFNLLIEHGGKTMVLKDWARELGIKYTTLYHRILRDGLPFEQAISRDPYGRLVTINKESKTVTEWCRDLNRHAMTVTGRIHDGWDRKRAILTPTPKPFSPRKKEVSHHQTQGT